MKGVYLLLDLSGGFFFPFFFLEVICRNSKKEKGEKLEAEVIFLCQEIPSSPSPGLSQPRELCLDREKMRNKWFHLSEKGEIFPILPFSYG